MFVGADVTSSLGYQTSTIYTRMGIAVLSGGGANVKNPWLSATSRIFLSNTQAGGTPGFVYVSSRSDGCFKITSTSSSDTSQIAWMLVSEDS